MSRAKKQQEKISRWEKMSNAYYIVSLIFGVTLIYAAQNSYKQAPDFLFYTATIYMLPLLALGALLIYFKLKEKSKVYWWLNCAIAYSWGIAFWQIAQNKNIIGTTSPFDLIVGNNLFGLSPGIFNSIALLPLIIFIIIAIVQIILEKWRIETRFSRPRTIVTIVVLVIGISLGLQQLHFAIRRGLLADKFSQQSSIVCFFDRVYTDDFGDKYVDVYFYDLAYSFEEEPFSFPISTETQFIGSNGEPIRLEDLEEQQKVEIVYSYRGEEEITERVIAK